MKTDSNIFLDTNILVHATLEDFDPDKYSDGHLEKTILQADKLLSFDEHRMLIHLMESIINNN